VDCHFILCEFSSRTKVDSIIITGRSTSYLISNEDVNETLFFIYNITNDASLFDFIDANRFIPMQMKTLYHS
jgi:hypothetical protein